MLRTHATALLGGAAAGVLMVLAGLGWPSPAFAQDYGGGPGVQPPSGQPPQVVQTIPLVPIGGGRSSTYSTTSAPLASISPASVSISPVTLAPRVAPAPAPAPPPPPPPVSQVLGRVVESPPPVPEVAPRVVAPPIEEEAPRSVARPPEEEEVLGRVVQRPGPGLVQARVLPKAGEGSGALGVWPPLVLALAGLALGTMALAWPRRRAAARLA
jgi:hypothetical protein